MKNGFVRIRVMRIHSNQSIELPLVIRMTMYLSYVTIKSINEL